VTIHTLSFQATNSLSKACLSNTSRVLTDSNHIEAPLTETTLLIDRLDPSCHRSTFNAVAPVADFVAYAFFAVGTSGDECCGCRPNSSSGSISCRDSRPSLGVFALLSFVVIAEFFIKKTLIHMPI